MCVLSRRNNLHKVFRSPIAIRCIIVPASFFLFSLLLVYEVGTLISQTKTIGGHNLEPTPWHPFPSKQEESKISRVSKIIQCSYLTCSSDSSSAHSHIPNSTIARSSCPQFFSHIHRDLQPWKKTKISHHHLMEAKKFAAFRVVIINGKLYVDFYYACVQSRMMFTIWGLLQLLKKYPGKIPDVDIMFDCMDKPTINTIDHASMPLPLFRYCTTSKHFDIPFPDWSFWGWPEINILPWDQEFKSIKSGSHGLHWLDKIPFAYWKGNPNVASPIRMDLMNCNDTKLWGAQILRQDWLAETKNGYQGSKLSNQCNHRYKIYAEGYAWSVSLKYIMSCGSVPLIVDKQYEDFFSRGLIPELNYLPIPTFDLCENIKYAVDWGNSNPSQAEDIGTRAQSFMGSLTMDRVYDYMYHLISEYAKLQDFTPIQPPSAQRMCVDTLLCYADEKQKEFFKESSTSPSISFPCTLGPGDSRTGKAWDEKKKKKKRKRDIIRRP